MPPFPPLPPLLLLAGVVVGVLRSVPWINAGDLATNVVCEIPIIWNTRPAIWTHTMIARKNFERISEHLVLTVFFVDPLFVWLL